MSSRAGFDDVRLEQALRDLGPRLAFPAEPDMAARVVAAIEARRTAPIAVPRPRWSPRVVAFGTAALVVIASLSLAFSPAAREAVADFLGIGGIRIEVGPGPTPTARPGENLSLGVRTTLEDARERVDFHVLVPDESVLSEPDDVYYSEFPSGGRVSLVYDAQPGLLPEARATGVGLLVTEFEGSIEGDMLKKLSLQQLARPTDVNGAPAFWVRGPHTLFFIDANGQQKSDTLRLSANALIWMDGDTTIRLESDLNLSEARAIAEAMS